MGMFLFAVMDKYGLFMAMILHALSNLLSYATNRALLYATTRRS
jgi:hypothetical protein